MVESDETRFVRAGSAREGSGHWWAQRVTSVALVPLVLWLGFSLASLPGLDHYIFLSWVRSPLNTVFLALFVMVAAYHAVLGLRVVVEDYVHSVWLKTATNIFVELLFFFLAVAGVLAIVMIISS